ncbi:GNAT family N-acetyltransferase [Flavobacterium terrisoli]|uniref:GNAT family N-acetyltransferase n=1 Tax=Flavobacterium terrisoli TaxID=3242195 RepID=UPI0025433A20|nr:GNAT family protein [Flavobacterium buctense]
MIEFEILETERLLLKKITPALFADLFANYPEAEIKKLLGLSTEEEFLKEKAKSEGGYTTYDRTILAFVLVSKESGQTIGRCGYHNWYKDHSRAELGYALNNDESKRKGYMGEAVKAILDYGFKVMNLNRIEAFIGPANEASLRLVKKNGFVQEGQLRQHFVRNGEAEDSVVFSLLKDDTRLCRTEQS